MAILAQASYLDLPDTSEKKSLYEFLNDNRGKLEEKLGGAYKQALNDLIDKVANNNGKNYTIVLTENDKHGTGFAAFAVADANNEVTVVCRGTEGFNLDYDSKKDVVADLELINSLQTSQQEKMDNFVAMLEKEDYSGYSFAGHSLGGNLATYGALILNDPDKLRECVTFNAPGFNAAFIKKNKDRISKVEDRIKSFQNERDCVSECFFVIGNIIILECDGWDIFHILGIDAHMLDTLVLNEDGTFKRNHTGKKDKTVIGYVLDKGTDLTDGVMSILAPIFIAYDYAKWKNERKNDIRRDFSQEAKQMLVGAAKETEEEKWWEVTKWDCWYKVDQFFGVLEWDLYAGNVDTYYRKLIDINDASVADIEKIFENVYGIDSNCSTTISTASDTLRSKVLEKLNGLRDSIVLN